MSLPLTGGGSKPVGVREGRRKGRVKARGESASPYDMEGGTYEFDEFPYNYLGLNDARRASRLGGVRRFRLQRGKKCRCFGSQTLWSRPYSSCGLTGFDPGRYSKATKEVGMGCFVLIGLQSLRRNM